jgi:Holliday junction DNA helicase RuvB
MSVSLGEEADTLEDVVEPFLIQSGLLKRTPRGRETTVHAWTHLVLEPPADRNSDSMINPVSGAAPGQGELL